MIAPRDPKVVRSVSMLERVDYGSPTSYLATDLGVDVFSSDGESVGKLEHVLADESEDVFDGIVINLSGPEGLHFADADDVEEFYERGVVLRIAAADVKHLPKPTPQPAALKDDGVGDGPGALSRKLHRAWELLKTSPDDLRHN
jgi:hypothetical protein